ncbi:hypothetical protein BJY04DRAFT_222414 [Aspergillus karnatakaensis]|uniref:uncharacterized protein n=1 Tax=Aspergillus karnatakaensis TaxID=1810916 RepID=UPI003CCD1554
MLPLNLLFLLTSLAALTHATPITTPDTTPNDNHPRAIGVWLDAYHSGSCDSGWESQPTSGWLWADQCKDLEPGTYGARLGNNHNGWSWCKLKFWEQAGCHGHATVTYVKNTEIQKKGGFYGDYQCIAAANKGGEFYLSGGARSVQLICDQWYY